MALNAQPGQVVRFVEINRGVAQTVAVTRASRGTRRFTPQAGGPARRQIHAIVEQDGRPRASLKVGSYTARSAARPGTVRKLRARGSGRRLTATWGPSARAEIYEAVVRLPDGAVRYVESKRRRFSVTSRCPGTARIKVRGRDTQGRLGPASRATVKLRSPR